MCGRPWESGSDFRVSLNANHSEMVKFAENDRDSHDKVFWIVEDYVTRACPVIHSRCQCGPGNFFVAQSYFGYAC